MTTPQRLTTLVAAAAFSLAGAAPAAGQAPAPTGGLEASVDRPGLELAPGALLNRTVAVRGRTTPDLSGRGVAIERRLLDGSWQQVATTLVDQDGTFRAPWRADQLGRVTLRAVVDRAGAAAAAADPLVAELTVFQRAVASWYGPGFFGRRTACGIRLTRRVVGVAHRTLPCGTRVEVYHRGRTLTLPVIDRGPFRPGRQWDLTRAAARQLGVRATVPVGVLAEGGVPLRVARRRAR